MFVHELVDDVEKKVYAQMMDIVELACDGNEARVGPARRMAGTSLRGFVDRVFAKATALLANETTTHDMVKAGQEKGVWYVRCSCGHVATAYSQAMSEVQFTEHAVKGNNSKND